MVEIHFGILAVQIVTFFIAIFILWKLFWKPIIKMMSERKNRIAEDLESANSAKKEAENIELKYRERLDRIEDESRTILAKSHADGQQIKSEMLKEAQDEAKIIIQHARAEITTEKDQAILELRQKTIALSVQIAEKILKESVDEKIQNRLADEFLDEIK